jgi:formyltetrahydrofolate synthetase
MDVFCTSNDILKWTLLLNPTSLSTTSFANYSTTTSNVMIDTSATTVSGGTIVGAGFIQQKGTADFVGIDNFNLQLGRTIAGTSDVLTLAVVSNGTNSKVGGGIGWYEIL